MGVPYVQKGIHLKAKTANTWPWRSPVKMPPNSAGPGDVRQACSTSATSMRQSDRAESPPLDMAACHVQKPANKMSGLPQAIVRLTAAQGDKHKYMLQILKPSSGRLLEQVKPSGKRKRFVYERWSSSRQQSCLAFSKVPMAEACH